MAGRATLIPQLLTGGLPLWVVSQIGVQLVLHRFPTGGGRLQPVAGGQPWRVGGKPAFVARAINLPAAKSRLATGIISSGL